MRINDYVEEVFCITTEDEFERQDHVAYQCDLHDINFKFLYTKKPLTGKGRLAKGEYGCYLGHRNAIMKAKRHRGNGNYLILEDDVVFANNFQERFEKFINELSEAKIYNWNVLALGYDIQHSVNEHQVISDNLLRLNHCWAGQSYIVNKNTLNLLLMRYNRELLIPDWYLSKYMVKSPGIYAPYPAITKQALFEKSILLGKNPLQGYRDSSGKCTWVNIANAFSPL